MRMKEIRKAQNLSQTYIGNLCGVTKSTISQYENGKREPDITTLKKIAAALNCTVDYLLGNDEQDDVIEQKKLFELFNDMTESELMELNNFVDYLLVKRDRDNEQTK